jgi:F0F1-type ATP synthase assembly protein I
MVSHIHSYSKVMNPYYYLFYKLTRFLNKKGNNEMGPIYGISCIVIMNIIFVYLTTLHIKEENTQGLYKTIFIIICIALFITNVILFQNKNRIKEIMNHYKGESETSRKLGNSLVILYILLSLGLIVFI